MAGYYVPAGEGTSEGVEKRSHFLGYVWRVASEEEARALIEDYRSQIAESGAPYREVAPASTGSAEGGA